MPKKTKEEKIIAEHRHAHPIPQKAFPPIREVKQTEFTAIRSDLNKTLILAAIILILELAIAMRFR